MQVLRKFRELLVDRSGVAAVEFALCASAFFGLLIGSLQIALVFFVQQGVQTASEVVARRVMTGQIASSTTQEQFRQQACAQLPAFLKCSNLFVDVRKAASFASVDTSAVGFSFDSSGQVNNSFVYETGNAGDIVVLRLVYRWPLGTAPLGLDLRNQGDGSRAIQGTMVFKSEPYA